MPSYVCFSLCTSYYITITRHLPVHMYTHKHAYMLTHMDTQNRVEPESWYSEDVGQLVPTARARSCRIGPCLHQLQALVCSVLLD